MKVILIIKVIFLKNLFEKNSDFELLFFIICIVQKVVIFIIRAVFKKDLILRLKMFRFPEK